MHLPGHFLWLLKAETSRRTEKSQQRIKIPSKQGGLRGAKMILSSKHHRTAGAVGYIYDINIICVHFESFFMKQETAGLPPVPSLILPRKSEIFWSPSFGFTGVLCVPPHWWGHKQLQCKTDHVYLPEGWDQSQTLWLSNPELHFSFLSQLSLFKQTNLKRILCLLIKKWKTVWNLKHISVFKFCVLFLYMNS